MKKIWILLPALLSVSLIACDAKKEEKETMPTTEKTIDEARESFGEVALKNQFETPSGNVVGLENILAQHQGKPAVIDVWASWCPDWIKGVPELKNLQPKYPEA